MSPHRSPALTLLFNEIKTSQHTHILDLGSMTKANFEFFSQLSCKVQVEDLSAYIIDAIHANDTQALESIDEYLIDYQKDEKFDVILLWDILNYLNLDSIEKLMQKLSVFSRTDTLVYTLRYLEKKIPKNPQRFHIRDQYFIDVEEEAPAERLYEAGSTVQLLKKIPDYKMQTTLMNKEGMHLGYIEHLLRYMPGQVMKKPQVSKVECYKSQLSKPVKASVHVSPALKMACNHLRRKKTANILDLGREISKNTDFFIERCQGFYNADLFPFLQWQKNKESNREIRQESLNIDPNIKFDVILTWDLLNYCDLKQILQINKILAKISQPDALLVSYVFSQNAIPEKPQQFYIVDRDRVSVSASDHQPMPGIELTCGLLLKTLRQFDLDASFFYRQGMSSSISEYIFKPKHSLTDELDVIPVNPINPSAECNK